MTVISECFSSRTINQLSKQCCINVLKMHTKLLMLHVFVNAKIGPVFKGQMPFLCYPTNSVKSLKDLNMN